MRILIDIGHPAHVHYFKNTIRILVEAGNQVFVVARAKDITFDLLVAYEIPFISRGKGKHSLIAKFFYLFLGSYTIWRVAKRNNIDCYLSFASPYNALASIFYRKPVITFDDTEHNSFNHRIYVPLSDLIITPEAFKKDFGEKHLRFKGTMDSAYLHPKYFHSKWVEFPVGINKKSSKKRNTILRLVSWHAIHDINQCGFSLGNIYKLLEALSEFSEIYISSESELPNDLKSFQIRIHPEEMHYYMQKADLIIGESGTMATESAYLGTHSIILNSASHELGVFSWYARYQTFHIADCIGDVIKLSIALLGRGDLKSEGKAQAELIGKDSICLTDFMIWLIKNYETSVSVIKEGLESFSSSSIS